MKKYLLFVLWIFMCADAGADVIYDHDTTIDCFSDTKITIGNGVTVHAPNGITMSEFVIDLYNNGTIDGTINITNRSLYIYNTVNNATINVNGGGNVIQMIETNAQVTQLNVNGDDYEMRMIGVDNVNFADIQNTDATKITITGGSIVMDDFNSWQNWENDVVLKGGVCLIINDANSVPVESIINHTFINNPLGGIPLDVSIPNLDKLYKRELTFNGSDVVLRIVRETNYSLIFGDKGNALDIIRARHPNDRLLSSLDYANSIDEINRLMESSYRFNHNILLRPLKMLNKFSSINLLRNENDSGVGVEPFYIASGKIDAMGGRVYVGYSDDDNLYFNAGFSLARFDYGDDLNEFSGTVYGLDIKSKQTINDFWLGEALGVSMTDFRADYISSNGGIKDNPFGWSLYGDVSGGYDFAIDKDITLSPIVGFTYQPYKVADVSDSDSYFHGGADIKYSFAMDGIKYEYSADLAIGTNGDVFANAKAGFTSITDNTGVYLNAGILKDDFDYYYRFSLDAKYLF